MPTQACTAIFELTDHPDELLLNVRNLVRAWDEDATFQQDSNPLKTFIGEELPMALLKRFLEDRHAAVNGQAVLLTDSSGRRLACTTGERRGFQLDGWMRLSTADSTVTYQTEIKSWSFHGIGSKSRRMLLENPDLTMLLQQQQAIFAHYYDAKHTHLRQQGTQKVLLRMAIPDNARRVCGYPVENVAPLLLLWEAVCPPEATRSTPFFQVPVASFESMTKTNGAVCASGGFGTLNVFSVSLYLRELLTTFGPTHPRPVVRLYLPAIARRLRHLVALPAIA